MKKIKRILAIGGVVILLGMYILTFISAMFATPNTHSLFFGSIAATIIIPIFIYAYTLIYRVVFRKNGEEDYEADDSFKENEEDMDEKS